MIGETKYDQTLSQISVNGRIALVSQQPWIMNATLRENILFGLPYDEEKYNAIIHACALQPDIKQLAAGDMTEIGERGINLSGGQKQRVSIARSVYNDADIYLLDDPLSAVDAHVGKHIFDNVICTLLKKKTIVLVTHQLQYLHDVDNIVVLSDDGRISQQGKFNTLISQEGSSFQLMMEEHNRSATTSSSSSSPPPLSSSSSLSSIADELEFAETSEQVEAKATSKASSSSSQLKISDKDTLLSSSTSASLEKPQQPSGNLMEKEERGIGAIKMEMYWIYLKAAKSFTLVFLILLGYIFAQITRIGTDWWIAKWSDASAADGGKAVDISYYLGIYILWGISSSAFILLANILIAFFAIRSSRSIHKELFCRILGAPLSFFETTPIGRILNRFSKDQDNVDIELPSGLFGYINTLTVCLGSLILMVLVLPWTLIGLAFLIVIYYFIQIYYRSTSRELKRLDSISKSPIFAHFSETLGGITIIRAFAVQNRFCEENNAKLDHNQQAYFYMVVANRWLGIRLDIIASLVVLLAALFPVLFPNTVDPSMVGLVLSYTFSSTSWMSWLVRSTAELEQNMNSIERIHFYSQVEQESLLKIDYDAHSVEKYNWPSQGEIEFKNVALKYRKDIDRLALHNVSFVIKAREKVGVCGRTGAGKVMNLFVFLLFVFSLFSLISLISHLSFNKTNTHQTLFSELTPRSFVPAGGTIQWIDPHRFHRHFFAGSSVLESKYGDHSTRSRFVYWFPAEQPRSI